MKFFHIKLKTSTGYTLLLGYMGSDQSTKEEAAEFVSKPYGQKAKVLSVREVKGVVD